MHMQPGELLRPVVILAQQLPPLSRMLRFYATFEYIDNDVGAIHPDRRSDIVPTMPGLEPGLSTLYNVGAVKLT
jgi:hypothetical protein